MKACLKHQEIILFNSSTS